MMVFYKTLLATGLALAITCSCARDTDPVQNPDVNTEDPGGQEPRPEHRGRVVASPDGRFLQYENGEPFFWLGDTAWLLIDRLTVEEARYYLTERAKQGYTIIQFSCLGDDYGVKNANYCGELAFLDSDYTIFNPQYFEHVKKVIDIADELGLVVGFLPNWGDKLIKLWGYETPVLHTKERAENYGRYIGELLKDKENVIYILGGDRGGDSIKDIINAQARGIAIGTSGREDYSKCTITYHPSGYQSSSAWFGSEEWLDFNMQQNGHGYDNVWERITRDYTIIPAKPVVDGEPTYDEHWLNFNQSDGLTSDLHCRRYFYHEVFSGAFGHTYGTTGIWSFYDPDVPFRWKKEDVPTTPWKESLKMQSGLQMVYGKNLMMSRPYFTRIPDNTIVFDTYNGHERVTATRDKDNTYAFIYTEQGRPVKVRINKIVNSPTANAWWFNPRTGKATFIEEVEASPGKVFTPESSGPGNDWILVIDDPAAGYPEPGTEVCKENK